MKTRIASLFLVLCMLLPMAVTVSSAAGAGTTALPEQACPGGGHSGWTEFPADIATSKTLGAADEETKYYLKTNITSDTSESIAVNGDVFLCLSGKRLETTAHANSRANFLSLAAGATLTICDCSVSPSAPEGTGKIVNVYATKADNRAVAVAVTQSSSTVNFQGGTIEGFTAYGGSAFSIRNKKDAKVIMTGGKITSCGNTTATDQPYGAVYVLTGTFTMEGGTITGNHTTNGGGIYVAEDGTAAISGGTITDNNADTNGGGIYVNTGGTATISGDAAITDNDAKNGGGIYVNTGGTVNLSGNAAISSNAASTGAGGGIYVYRGTATISGGTISGNNAGTNGGGIGLGSVKENTSCTVTISGGTISGNSADNNGGDLYVPSNASVKGTTISDNNGAGTKVGNIYVGAADMLTISGGRFCSVPDSTVDTANGVVAVCDNADDAFPFIVGKGYAVEKIADPENGGTVSLSPADTRIPAGAIVTVTAEPNAGYKLKSISVDGADIDEKFTMPAKDVTVTAAFQSDGRLDVGRYKDSESYDAPERDGFVFAGWFTTDEYNGVYDAVSGFAYAKFVAKNVLTVKAQAKVNDDGSTAEMRLVTSVDSLNYDKVGFVITFNEITADPVFSTEVYEAITANDEYQDPTIFHDTSLYFMTFTITKIPADAFDGVFTVVPYWTTLDDTTVYGEPESFSVAGLIQN